MKLWFLYTATRGQRCILAEIAVKQKPACLNPNKSSFIAASFESFLLKNRKIFIYMLGKHLFNQYFYQKIIQI